MPTLAHRSKVRRAERAVLLRGQQNINLVPLVDILTSIVFFSLLTYTGEQLGQLTAYDLSLPPQVITAPDTRTRGQSELLNLLLAVRVETDKLIVEHSEENGFRQEIRGTSGQSLDQLQALMTQIRQKYPQNSDVLVVPADAVNYDNVIKVLERLRMSNFTGVSLGSRARATQVSSGGEVTR